MVIRLFLMCAVAANAGWVERSNEHTQVLLKVTAAFNPEGASGMGVDGMDDRIVDLKPEFRARMRKATEEAQAELTRRLQAETDPLVKQDIEVLLDVIRRQLRGMANAEKRSSRWFDVGQMIYFSTQALLDDQIEASRRPAALTRLRKYTGLEKGYEPVTAVAEREIRERLNKEGVFFPSRLSVENSLRSSETYVRGIGKLFDQYKIAGFEEAYNLLKKQIAEYDAFVRKELLPRARADFRQPEDIYALALENFGVDIPPAQLAARAHKSYLEFQGEMQQIAVKMGYKDYRDAIRELKKKQITGEAILPFYRKRLGEIEAIVRRENLVTLPTREARISIASEAETAAQPAPHMKPPRLIGNKGEMGEFVLPLTAEKGLTYDDFTFDAAAWTLSVHELRPGHEMQFASMVEKGVSNARAIFAFNSTNVEGWGLYSEWMMKPFLPLDGQLISMQHRMMRAARAFLDPELHMGKIKPEDAQKILENDVMLSPAMATQEVQRYTFRMPGQATSYYYGYTRLLELRAEVEKKLGPKFDAKKFHDFILSQGLLPPGIMRKTALAAF